MSGMRISFFKLFIFLFIALLAQFLSRMFWLSHAELNIAQYFLPLFLLSPLFPINTMRKKFL
jgi:hypothetical protein